MFDSSRTPRAEEDEEEAEETEEAEAEAERNKNCDRGKEIHETDLVEMKSTARARRYEKKNMRTARDETEKEVKGKATRKKVVCFITAGEEMSRTQE